MRWQLTEGSFCYITLKRLGMIKADADRCLHFVGQLIFPFQAITNSTYGHHGEMAFPEVTLVPWKDTPAFSKH